MTAVVEVLCCLFGLYGVTVEYGRCSVVAVDVNARVVGAELRWTAVADGNGLRTSRPCGAAVYYKVPCPWGYDEAGVFIEFRGRASFWVLTPRPGVGQSYSEVRLFPARGR